MIVRRVCQQFMKCYDVAWDLVHWICQKGLQASALTLRFRYNWIYRGQLDRIKRRRRTHLRDALKLSQSSCYFCTRWGLGGCSDGSAHIPDKCSASEEACRRDHLGIHEEEFSGKLSRIFWGITNIEWNLNDFRSQAALRKSFRDFVGESLLKFELKALGKLFEHQLRAGSESLWLIKIYFNREYIHTKNAKKISKF